MCADVRVMKKYSGVYLFFWCYTVTTVTDTPRARINKRLALLRIRKAICYRMCDSAVFCYGSTPLMVRARIHGTITEE